MNDDGNEALEARLAEADGRDSSRKNRRLASKRRRLPYINTGRAHDQEIDVGSGEGRKPIYDGISDLDPDQDYTSHFERAYGQTTELLGLFFGEHDVSDILKGYSSRYSGVKEPEEELYQLALATYFGIADLSQEELPNDGRLRQELIASMEVLRVSWEGDGLEKLARLLTDPEADIVEFATEIHTTIKEALAYMDEGQTEGQIIAYSARNRLLDKYLLGVQPVEHRMSMNYGSDGKLHIGMVPSAELGLILFPVIIKDPTYRRMQANMQRI